MGDEELMRGAALVHIFASCYTDKKENEIFLIYKEIKMGSVAKSYMRIL
jgi:hypothetical protein